MVNTTVNGTLPDTEDTSKIPDRYYNRLDNSKGSNPIVAFATVATVT